MTRRILLLELEGAVVVDTFSQSRSNAVWQGLADDVRLTVPEDARSFEVTGPADRPHEYFVQPGVVEGVRALAEAGVDILWNSRWLATPDRLGAFAEQLGLADAVRMPTVDELPVAPNLDWIGIRTTPFWEHWKVVALVEWARRLAPDDELVIVDRVLDVSARRLSDGIAHRVKARDRRLGSLSPHEEVGLDGASFAVLAAWAAGASLAAAGLAVAPPEEPVWHR